MNTHSPTAMKLLILLLAPAAALAGPRASTNYALVTDTLDSAGGRAASASYQIDTSLGAGSLATATATSTTLKGGYTGQLFEITALTLDSEYAAVEEGGSFQLTATLAYDDDTFAFPTPEEIDWSVESGPLIDISAGGLATAAAVYQDTDATAAGTYAGLYATFPVSVLDFLTDNFGSYADDGLEDTWQVAYFGEGNPDAAPTLDPDGDGQTNWFEYVAGLIPTDPASRFMLRIEPVPSQPTHRNLVLHPVLEGRTYSVIFRDSLTPGDWTPLPAPILADHAQTRTITDTNAITPTRFYRVEISR